MFLPSLKEYYLIFFLMTSQVGSHGTTDIKPEMLSGVQTRNGIQHVEHHICCIAHVHAYRKDNLFMQRLQLLSVAPPLSDLKEKNQIHQKKIPHAGIAYSVCTIPPLWHICYVRLSWVVLEFGLWQFTGTVSIISSKQLYNTQHRSVNYRFLVVYCITVYTVYREKKK